MPATFPSLRKGIFLPLAIAALVAGEHSAKRKDGENPRADRTGKQLRKEPYSRRIDVMGTFASVTFYESRDQLNGKAADTVFGIFRDMDERFSNYLPGSELSRINRHAFEKPFPCSAEMWEMLLWCRRAHEASHGAFDVTAGPIVALWGMHRPGVNGVPQEAELQEAMKRTGMDKLVFDDGQRTIRFGVEGMSLDLGGIAKGYAVDKAADAVRALGVTRGIIDLGGNLSCLEGAPPGRDAYRVGIRNPFKPAPGQPPGAVVSFKGRSVATSGGYERHFTVNGRRYGHIMDVRTGRPVRGMAGVSVISDKAVVSDMLSTSIFINGGMYVDEILEDFPSVKVLILRKADGRPAELESFPENDLFWDALPPAGEWER